MWCVGTPLQGDGSPPPMALGMQELARCMQMLEGLEATESEIR